MREIRMLRSTWRGLETWHGRDAVTLADERARQQATRTSTYTGAPVSDPTCERLGVKVPGPTRQLRRLTDVHSWSARPPILTVNADVADLQPRANNCRL